MKVNLTSKETPRLCTLDWNEIISQTVSILIFTHIIKMTLKILIIKKKKRKTMNKFAIEKRKIGKKTKKNRLDVRNNFNFKFNCILNVKCRNYHFQCAP